MEFVNDTPLPAMQYEVLDQHEQRFHAIVFKATYDWVPVGARAQQAGPTHTLHLAADQNDLVLTDEYYGEVNGSSVRVESDLAHYKPSADVIVLGEAHAPFGRPSKHWNVRLHVTRAYPLDLPAAPRPLNPAMPLTPAQQRDWERALAKARANADRRETLLKKTLTVHGERFWQKSVTGWSLGARATALTVPLRYEFAYGGEHKLFNDNEVQVAKANGHDPRSVAPVAHIADPHNPLGTGYLPADAPHSIAKSLAKLGRIRAAQIFYPGDGPTRDIRRGHRVAGFGVVARAWQPRLPLAGTYDQTWIDTRWPLLPEDFDFGYWNGAPSDQQCKLLQGDERIELLNVVAHRTVLRGSTHRESKEGQTVAFDLPGQAVIIRIHLADGGSAYAGARIDTAILDCEQRKAWLTYRLLFAADLVEVTRAQAWLQDTRQERPLRRVA